MESNLLVVGGQIFNIDFLSSKIHTNIPNFVGNRIPPKGVNIDWYNYLDFSTLLGMKIPNLCVRVQYLDSSWKWYH